jgi:RimJ/RimL family protein N-acetyltransferase
MSLTLLPATDAHFAWLLGETDAPPGLALPPGGIDEPWVYKWLRRTLRRMEGRGSWLMVRDGEAVGMCSYKGPPDAEGAVEIGYGVAPQRRLLGHATAAVALLVAEARGDPRVRRLVAETALSNLVSQRVVEANNFLRTGVSHDDDEGEMIVWTLELGDGEKLVTP